MEIRGNTHWGTPFVFQPARQFQNRGLNTADLIGTVLNLR